MKTQALLTTAQLAAQLGKRGGRRKKKIEGKRGGVKSSNDNL